MRDNTPNASLTGITAGQSPLPSSAPMSASEILLAGAPRIDVAGKSCPALGGIALQSKLGEGGMGAVYFGVHPRLNIPVAVKVLTFRRAEQYAEIAQRFFREAQLATLIRSPHLIGVMDVNQENGLIYLVMEYVHGQSAHACTVEARRAGKSGLSEAAALDICIAATRGLAAAHALGTIHRDVKPENILVPAATGAGAAGWQYSSAKLADLGLARSETIEQPLTGSQTAIGTPGYMAPEQASHGAVAGKRADVFSMGATLFYLLTGCHPFKGATALETILATLNRPPEPLSADVSMASAALIGHCLKKPPEQRYADANALLQALLVCRSSLDKDEYAQRDAILELNLIRDKPETAIFTGGVSQAQPVSGIAGGAAARPGPKRSMAAPALFAVAALIAGGAMIGIGVFRHAPELKPPPAPGTSEIATTPISPPSPAPPAKPPAPSESQERAYRDAVNEIQAELKSERAGADGRYSALTDEKRETIYAALARGLGARPGDAKLTDFREALKNPQQLTLHAGGAAFDFVLVPAGSFQMGSDASSDEQPVRKTTLSRAFYAGKFPVTVAQFRAFVNDTKYVTAAESGGTTLLLNNDGVWSQLEAASWRDGRFTQADSHPVVVVSWNDARKFAEWMSAKTGRKLRLPTEAEWEYAARGPKNLKYPWGMDWDGAKANHADAALKASDLGQKVRTSMFNDGYAFTSPVGALDNASWCGAFDMSGNAWQWCADWLSANYDGAAETDPAGPATGKSRVCRGGSWSDLPLNCRTAERHGGEPGTSYSCVGFRVALTAPADPP